MSYLQRQAPHQIVTRRPLQRTFSLGVVGVSDTLISFDFNGLDAHNLKLGDLRRVKLVAEVEPVFNRLAPAKSRSQFVWGESEGTANQHQNSEDNFGAKFV